MKIIFGINGKKEDVYEYLSNPKNFGGIYAKQEDILIIKTEKNNDGEIIVFQFDKDPGFGIPVVTTTVTQTNNEKNYIVKTIAEDNFGLIRICIDYYITKGSNGTTEVTVQRNATGHVAWLSDGSITEVIDKVSHKLNKHFHK